MDVGTKGVSDMRMTEVLRFAPKEKPSSTKGTTISKSALLVGERHWDIMIDANLTARPQTDQSW